MSDQLPAVKNSNTLMIAHVIYGIFAFSALSAASVVGVLVGFVGFVGVILAHVYRNDTQGSWLTSHYTWLVKTFWWSLVWVAIGWVFAVTIVGLVIGVPIWTFVFLWTAYRIIWGLIKLFREQPV